MIKCIYKCDEPEVACVEDPLGHLPLGVQALQQQHDRAGAVVGGKGGRTQRVDVATIINLHRATLRTMNLPTIPQAHLQRGSTEACHT